MQLLEALINFIVSLNQGNFAKTLLSQGSSGIGPNELGPGLIGSFWTCLFVFQTAQESNKISLPYCRGRTQRRTLRCCHMIKVTSHGSRNLPAFRSPQVGMDRVGHTHRWQNVCG